METLNFITSHGVCGHSCTWNCENAEYDADGWLENFGDRIGSGTAPLPTGGFIDLSQFATITKQRQGPQDMKTDAIDALISMVEKDVGLEPGGNCQDEPDDESVGSTIDGPLPMTFGHVRRARKELNDLHQ